MMISNRLSLKSRSLTVTATEIIEFLCPGYVLVLTYRLSHTYFDHKVHQHQIHWTESCTVYSILKMKPFNVQKGFRTWVTGASHDQIKRLFNVKLNNSIITLINLNLLN